MASKDRVRRNFTREELACPCCGFMNISEDALDKLQDLRDLMGAPLKINSAARCPKHNKAVGGAPRSQHLSTPDHQSTAFDVALAGHDKTKLIELAEFVGFRGIGSSYRTFVHIDDRGRYARW